MNRRDFLYTGLGLSFLPTPLLSRATAPNKLPKVLLLGDSISIGYWPFVTAMMKDDAIVVRPMREENKAENCEGTTKGRTELDRWLGTEQWDLIHFNFGLHDLKHVDPVTLENSKKLEDPRQAEPKQYKQNLKEITARLRETGAKLIFATTTPYPEKQNGPLREYEDELTYNRIAKKIMRKNDIPVNDLHAFVLPKMADLQIPNNVHFTPAGSEALAEVVCQAIRAQLL